MAVNSNTKKNVNIFILCASYVSLHITGFAMNSSFDLNNDPEEDLDLPLFDFPTIANATNDFSEKSKLGEGGFGSVYKVTLTLIMKRRH